MAGVVWCKVLGNVSFIVSLSTAAVTGCPDICRLSMRQSCSIQGHDKTDTSIHCLGYARTKCRGNLYPGRDVNTGPTDYKAVGVYTLSRRSHDAVSFPYHRSNGTRHSVLHYARVWHCMHLALVIIQANCQTFHIPHSAATTITMEWCHQLHL